MAVPLYHDFGDQQEMDACCLCHLFVTVNDISFTDVFLPSFEDVSMMCTPPPKKKINK